MNFIKIFFMNHVHVKNAFETVFIIVVYKNHLISCLLVLEE